jgi:hypothetical protein
MGGWMAPPPPGTHDPTWQDQWRRTERWMLRLRAAEEDALSYIGQPWCDPNEGLLLYKDDVIAFFQACYHLKDWLKKDPASAEKAGDVETFVNETECLQLAADVCNRSKHGLADRNPRLDPNAQPRTHRIVIYSQDGQFQMVGGETILVGGEGRPAVEVAEQCLAAWTSYLRDRAIT